MPKCLAKFPYSFYILITGLSSNQMIFFFVLFCIYALKDLAKCADCVFFSTRLPSLVIFHDLIILFLRKNTIP